MELSVKKINRALEYFIDGENYKYNPTQFMFDYNSDEDYAYMAIKAVYIIRVPKSDLPEVLKHTTLYPAINREAPLERLINTTVQDKKHRPVFIKEISEISETNKKRVVKFTDGGDTEIWIDVKFFEQFYNKPITKYEDNNITFTATPDTKSPVVMWNENDEAIAMFLPINHG